jgi:diguanylate cyclase (GGDEF)-like protein
MRADSEHERFSKQLTDAFELAETEADIATVAARAMQNVSPELPMELLIAETGGTELHPAAAHPTAGSPGCAVRSPAKCVAVRRGSTVTFADSNQLNACPYLRGRHENAAAAACVPLSFMGKSLGVLHATSRERAPFPDAVIANLETLALGTGTRTGTVRAFQRTQLQAMTDSLTGLMNRRALEAEMRDLARSGGSFALVVADLDYFKRLNDAYGHQTGDEALRKFGAALRASLRSDDRAARWGGEEFVVLLVGTVAMQAADWVERLRERLAGELEQSEIPVFTSSFGIADSSMAKDPAVLMRIADTALYVAKNQGRDRASIGSADFALEPDRQARIESEPAAPEDTAQRRALTGG